jgi:hypothetical protein
LISSDAALVSCLDSLTKAIQEIVYAPLSMFEKMVQSRSSDNDKQAGSPIRSRSNRQTKEQMGESSTGHQNKSNSRNDEISIKGFMIPVVASGEKLEERCRKRKRSEKLNHSQYKRPECILQRLEHHNDQNKARRYSQSPRESESKYKKAGKSNSALGSGLINDPDYSESNEHGSWMQAKNGSQRIIKSGKNKNSGNKGKRLIYNDDEEYSSPLKGNKEKFLENVDIVSQANSLKSSATLIHPISKIRPKIEKISKVISVENRKFTSDYSTNCDTKIFFLDNSDSEYGSKQVTCRLPIPAAISDIQFSRNQIAKSVDDGKSISSKVINDIDYQGPGKDQRFAKSVDNNPVALRISSGKNVSGRLGKNKSDKRQSHDSMTDGNNTATYPYRVQQKSSKKLHDVVSSISHTAQLATRKNSIKVHTPATETHMSSDSVHVTYDTPSNFATLSAVKRSAKKKGLKHVVKKEEIELVNIQDSIMVNVDRDGLTKNKDGRKQMRKTFCNPNSPLNQCQSTKPHSKNKARSQSVKNARQAIGKRKRKALDRNFFINADDLQVCGYDSFEDRIESEEDWTDEDDGFLRILAKSKKEPRSGNALVNTVLEDETGSSINKNFNDTETTLNERDYFPREQENCYLDEVSEMAHRISMAKLEKVSAKASILFLQSCIVEWYDKAEKSRRSIIKQKNDNAMEKISLLSARTSIAGIWCIFARLILLLAHAVLNKASVTNRWISRDFDHIEEQPCEEVSKFLIDFAFMVLDQATCCPLVGNHAWIALTYSKIAQIAHRCSIFHREDDSIIASHRSLNAAVNVCKQATGNGRDSKPYFDERTLIQLEKIGICDVTSTVSLWHRMGNVVAGDKYSIDDHASKLLLIQEIGILEFRQSLIDHFSPCAPDWLSLSQDLLRLTIPADVTCIFVHNLSQSDESLTSIESTIKNQADKKLEAISRINGVTFGHNLKLRQGPIDKAFKYFDVDSIDTTESQSCFEELSFESIHICNSASKIFQTPITDLPEKFTIRCDCQTCDSNFIPSSQVNSNLPQLKCAFTSVDISNTKRNISFGESSLVGDWSRHSLDPESGPFLSHEESSNVLAYSVELFEADCIDSLTSTGKFREYSLHTPFFVGQIGLRCQYCRSAIGGCFDIPGSFVFPESVEKLPMAMWYLSMTHLDDCANQPRNIRTWHHEYRKHVNMSSFLPSDYWSNVANDCDLFSVKRGGIVCRPNLRSMKLSCRSQGDE